MKIKIKQVIYEIESANEEYTALYGIQPRKSICLPDKLLIGERDRH